MHAPRDLSGSDDGGDDGVMRMRIRVMMAMMGVAGRSYKNHGRVPGLLCVLYHDVEINVCLRSALLVGVLLRFFTADPRGFSTHGVDGETQLEIFGPCALDGVVQPLDLLLVCEGGHA